MSRNNPIFRILLALIAGLLILLAFVGCKGSQLPTLPNASERSRDSVRTEYIHDSIYIDRWHREYTKGDTCYIHDSIDRWRDRNVYIHDSIDNSRIDTIYQPVEIEKKGSAFLRGSGIALWVLIATLVLSVIIGIIINIAK